MNVYVLLRVTERDGVWIMGVFNTSLDARNRAQSRSDYPLRGAWTAVTQTDVNGRVYDVWTNETIDGDGIMVGGPILVGG